MPTAKTWSHEGGTTGDVAPQTGASQIKGEHLEKPCPALAYHSAAIVEVMLVLVGVSTEVHARCHSRERPPLLQAQPAVDGYILVGDLWREELVTQNPPTPPPCNHARCVAAVAQGWDDQDLVLVGLRRQPLVKRSNLGGQVLKASPEQLFLW